jgi:hypothetical protein
MSDGIQRDNHWSGHRDNHWRGCRADERDNHWRFAG